MVEPTLPAMSGWENFYVIIGSSGAALIGLQFVVIALIRDTRSRTNSGAISAFGTPTVVHLGGALIISAIMSAPWPSLFAVSLPVAIAGFCGAVYTMLVIIHARRQRDYAPGWQDWLWFIVLPCLAYLAIGIAAITVRSTTRASLFVIAAAALGLLLIAIHNAWDTVTYIVLTASERERAESEQIP